MIDALWIFSYSSHLFANFHLRLRKTDFAFAYNSNGT